MLKPATIPDSDFPASDSFVGPFLFNSNELVSTSSSVICREKNNSIKRNFKFLVKLISFDHSKKIDAYSSFLFFREFEIIHTNSFGI